LYRKIKIKRRNNKNKEKKIEEEKI